MRWVNHEHGKVKRGEGAPPVGGASHFVDAQGSKALIDGKLYINGQPAPPGQYRIALQDVELPVEVDSKGGAKRKPIEKRGGGINGPGR